MDRGRKLFWVDLNRFDTKPDKSTWLEMSDVLARRGYKVAILTGYGNDKHQPRKGRVSIRYFRSIGIKGLFRLKLLLSILVWLIQYGGRDDIYLLPPGALYVAPVLTWLGRRNIHLDVRTVPVDKHSFVDRINVLFFWKVTMSRLRGYAKGYSFITDGLRIRVQDEFGAEFGDYVIWRSAVNLTLFRPQRPKRDDGESGSFVVLYHGTMSRNRGVLRLVNAIEMLKGEYRDRIVLRLIGNGPAYDEVRRYVAKQGLEQRIEARGYVPYEAIPGEIAEADCCICPLPDFPEWEISSPIKVFEYMAAGRPMILTPIAAHRDAAQACDYVVWTDGVSSSDLKRAVERAYDAREALTAAASNAVGRVRQSLGWDIQGERLARYLARLPEVNCVD